MTNRKYRKIFAKVAKKHGVSVKEVERDIAFALNYTPENTAQPTPKQVISRLADQVKKTM